MRVIATEVGASIYDERKGQYLPFNFPSCGLAEAFLAAAERTGSSLYAGMPHSDMRNLFAVWHDAYKRDWASDETGQRSVA